MLIILAITKIVKEPIPHPLSMDSTENAVAKVYKTIPTASLFSLFVCFSAICNPIIRQGDKDNAADKIAQ